MEKRIEEVGQELRKSEAKCTTLTKDLQTKEQAVETVQTECSYLKTKLKELKIALEESGQSTREMEEKLKVYINVRLDIHYICNGIKINL